MKKLMHATILVLFFLAMIQPVHSQGLLRKLQDKVQERVEEKVEERVERKTDETIDKQLDKIEESLENKTEDANENKVSAAERDNLRQQRMQNILKGVGVSGEPVPYSPTYDFNHLVQMHVESYDKNGKKESEGEFITHLNPDSKCMAYQMISGDIGSPGQGLFIIDAVNGATIILGEENGEKTGIVYGMGAFFSSVGEELDEAYLEDTPEQYLLNPNVSKTGRTKSIAGYHCEEYKVKDEITESEIWITSDLKMNTRNFFNTLFKTSLYAHGIPWGYMMEATTINKENGEKSQMKVTKVDTRSNVRFAMSDYKVTNLGSFKIQAAE